MKQYNYYADQLRKLEFTESMQVKMLDGEGNETNWLTLNLESISELKQFLFVLENDLKSVDKKER